MKKRNESLTKKSLHYDMLLSCVKEFCSDMKDYDHDAKDFGNACGFSKNPHELSECFLLMYMKHRRKSEFAEDVESIMNEVGNNRVFAVIITNLLNFIVSSLTREVENEEMQ